jgi:hypothetical protein
VVPLPDQIDDRIARATADGAPIYQTIAAYDHDIEVVIPPAYSLAAGALDRPARRDCWL